MEKKATPATTMRLTAHDRAAIARIKDLYGCPSDIAAIRLALRVVARQEPQEEGAAPSPDTAGHSSPSLGG